MTTPESERADQASGWPAEDYHEFRLITNPHTGNVFIHRADGVMIMARYALADARAYVDGLPEQRRTLCAHAGADRSDGSQHAHWLEPGEACGATS